MKAITVGTTPTLLAAAGNRNFINIYNNDANPIYLCYDGGSALDGSGFSTKLLSGYFENFENDIDTLHVANAVGIAVGMQITGTGIPDGVLVTSVTVSDTYSSVSVTAFTATADANPDEEYVFNWPPLTVDNGWPIPGNGGQLYLSNDGHRNVYDRAVYAISAAGGADVRVQGA